MMRKILVSAFVGLLSVAVVHGLAYAAITGSCDTCHTMHNSQGGTDMATFGTGQGWFTAGPYTSLLRGNCLGCHGQAAGQITTVSGQGIPQVYHSTTTTDLAGGNFYYIDTSDTYGHNVDFLSNPEGTAAMFPPPGDEFSQSGITSTTFTCAGVLGCHGNRATTGSYAAVKGAHHGNQGGQLTTASTVANSYRFLLGVHGYEDTDWQSTITATDHNEYKGATSGTEGTKTSPGGNTISGLCAECHGNFHGGAADIGTQSPWLRHPTDTDVIAKGGEYASYNTNNAYNTEAPIARATIPTTPGGTASSGESIVMCLSCHRAHGSAYADILRWCYSNMVAGSTAQTGGCFVCHTEKND